MKAGFDIHWDGSQFWDGVGLREGELAVVGVDDGCCCGIRVPGCGGLERCGMRSGSERRGGLGLKLVVPVARVVGIVPAGIGLRMEGGRARDVRRGGDADTE